jgi:hypothetical protein
MDVKIDITLLLFREDNVSIAYSPAFDLSGYGNTEKEAKDSFKIAIEEFIRYTTNKNTFFSELKRLGWNIPKSSKSKVKREYREPAFHELIKSQSARDIVNNKNFKKVSQPVIA